MVRRKSEGVVVKAFQSLIDLHDETGAPCLAFANTLDWHAAAQPVETLHNYADLITWAAAAELVNAVDCAALLALAAAQPDAAATVYTAALDLREAIYRLFTALSREETPPLADLALINHYHQQATTHLQLVHRGKRFGWQWTSLTADLDAPLWPIAWSTVELATSPWLERVKQCEDERGCGFLFIDTSKNRSRRWCSMESCGNRAKVQRHRARRAATK